MASKKEAEGILLLSMYKDEEDDDDMEDAAAAADGGGEDREVIVVEDGDQMEGEGRRASQREVNARAFAEEEVEEDGFFGVDEGDTIVRAVAVEVRRQGRRTTEKVAIVDYAHDELAMSPGKEEEEIEGKSIVAVHESSQSVSGDFQDTLTEEAVQVLSPRDQAISLSSEHMNSFQHETGNLISTEPNATEGDIHARAIGPLDKFLPPPPNALCSQEIQDKVRRFLKHTKAGNSFNAGVRNRKDYRNPDFLLHAVRYQGIDHVGSCFSKEIFDPHGYDQSDYYDEIEADMKREQERKDQARKKNQQIDFVSAGAQAAVAAAIQKVNISVTAVGDRLRSADAAPRDGIQKKSKWDKVDDDRMVPLPPVGKASVSAAAAVHAGTLSTGNAGAGYTAFAQQRRREAEERRSVEKKLDRRS